MSATVEAPTAQSLFDQLTSVERAAVASLVGSTDCPGFRNYLRGVKPLPLPFTLGDAATAYLRHVLTYLETVA